MNKIFIILFLLLPNLWAQSLNLYKVKVNDSTTEIRTCLAGKYHLDGFNHQSKIAIYFLRTSEQWDEFQTHIKNCESFMGLDKISYELDKKYNSAEEHIAETVSLARVHMMAASTTKTAKLSVKRGMASTVNLKNIFSSLSDQVVCDLSGVDEVQTISKHLVQINLQKRKARIEFQCNNQFQYILKLRAIE
jgi:hypothetical protein